MEFVDLSRYMAVSNPRILPLSELRVMKPVWMTQELQLAPEQDNISYAQSLASQGVTVVPILRQPFSKLYIDRISFPRRVLVEMTSRCNFLCRMCPRHGLKRPQMDMPSELYKQVVDEIDSYGVEGLWLYHLGEPLLHPEFAEILGHVGTKKNLGVIWTSTNGYYLNEDNINLILASGIWWLNFSAHSITKEVYETICPPGNFETVHANLERFYALKGTVNLPRKPYLHCQMIEQETTKYEVDAFINKHYKRAEVVSISLLEYVGMPNNKFGFVQRKRKPLSSCTRVSRNTCLIFSNGDVTLCDAAYNAEICLGNINKQSLYDIWNGEERKRILKLNAEGRMDEIDFCCTCTDYDI